MSMFTKEVKTTATVNLGIDGSEVTFRVKQEDGGFNELKLPAGYAKRLGKRLIGLAEILEAESLAAGVE